MSLTNEAVAARAAAVKNAVSFVGSCSAATVSSLDWLLHPPRELRIASKGKTNSSKISKKTTAASRTTNAIKSRPSKKAVVVEVLEVEEVELSLQEKIALATEVFNTSLKVLSEEVKAGTKSITSKNSLDAAQRRRSSSTRLSRTTSISKQPLQACSPNKSVRSPASPIALKRSTSSNVTLLRGRIAVAECARLALSSLRTSNPRKQNDQRSNDIQLEQGMSALIGKLIQLGMNDLAEEELRLLRKQLDSILGKSFAASGEELRRKLDLSRPDKATIVELLRFVETPVEGNIICLIIAFQFHVLRILIAEKGQGCLTTIIDYLKLSLPGSPSVLIMLSVEKKAQSQTKAAQQLQTLSQLVSALATNKIVLENDRIDQEEFLHHARDVFSLQVMSLELRCLWWQVSQHQSDLTMELWNPFARILNAFIKKIPGSSSGDYSAAKQAFTRLQAATKSSTVPDNAESGEVAIITTLAGFARHTGDRSDSLELYEMCATNSQGNDTNLARSCTRLCQIALLKLESLSEVGALEVSESVQKATGSLRRDLKGSSSDLEQLMLEGARLRKLAMSHILTSTKTTENESKIPTTSDLRDCLVSYVQAFVPFLLRYIGQPPEEIDKKAFDRFEERLKGSRNIARVAVEGIVGLAKSSLSRGPYSWEMLEPTLSECIAMADCLYPGCKDIGATGSATSHNSIHVSLSNLFWSRYLRDKQSSGEPKVLLRPVRKAVDLLRNRSISERKDGFAHIKWERLASVYLDLNRLDEAEMAWEESIRCHIVNGALQTLSSIARLESISHTGPDQAPDILTFRHLLSTFVGSRHKRTNAKNSFPYFDDHSLSTDERSVLLELQLDTILQLPKEQIQPDGLNKLAEALLKLYVPTLFPVRRLRVVLHLSRFMSAHTDILSSTLASTINHELSEELSTEGGMGSDAGLARYKSYLNGAKKICSFFCGFRTQADLILIDEALSLWSNLITVQAAVVESCVESIEEMAKQLETLADYLDMQGAFFRKLKVLDLLSRLYELSKSEDVSPLVISLSRHGLQLIRLGYSGEAGITLAKTKGIIDQYAVSPKAQIQWHFAYAEYLLEIGNVQKCTETLDSARALFAATPTGVAKNVHERLSFDKQASDAHYVYSLAAVAKGELVVAMHYAKCCVRLNTKIWSTIERRGANDGAGSNASSSETEIESLAEGISEMNIATNRSRVPSTLQNPRGCSFWPFVARHYHGLCNLSLLCAHFGTYQYALHYADQAQQVAEAVHATPFISRIKSLKASLLMRGGKYDEARPLMKAALSASISAEKTSDLALMYSFWSDLCIRCGDIGEANSALKRAGNILEDVSVTNPWMRLKPHEETKRLEAIMADLKIEDVSSKKKTAPQRKTDARKTAKPRPAPRSMKAKAEMRNSSASAEMAPLSRLKGLLLRQKASHLLLENDFAGAVSALAEASEVHSSRSDRFVHLMLVAQQLRLDVMRELSSHAVYCVLSESTISYPSARAAKERHSSILSPRTAQFNLTPPAQKKKSLNKSGRVKTQKRDLPELFGRIKEVLQEAQALVFKCCSSHDVHRLSFVQGQFSMLLHATQAVTRSVTNSMQTIHHIDLGRSIAMYREHASLRIDKALSDRAMPSIWPEPLSPDVLDLEQLVPSDPASFQTKYVDIIPLSWTVLSISLSESHDELLLSKVQANQTPFFVRLPLKRSSAQVDDGIDFSFDHAKEELLKVLKLANESSHEARGLTETAAKKKWWTERECLDNRLGELLRNMETLWFGGFRGIFSNRVNPTESLRRFTQSFQNILNRHLPSRQKARKTETTVQLHLRVMELFVGLGSPSDDDTDLEDSLMDLLYFVVDILQFQGEHNAYDEIDFDMIIVETIDALKCYHQEAEQSAKGESSRHLILILDKSLHPFPWESLPCLDGMSVSRLPSLGCLRGQLLRQEARLGGNSAGGFCIDKTHGSYILNPSGDLRSTQSTFTGPFKALKNWTSITERIPTAFEFQEALESHDLFLYFGHGSGAQYIPSRTVRRVEKCAATFLMGCSSGTLTEAGEFEPYGTPWNYMHAGCPALVATLWDVTDKDIDRFAMGTFERWGLLSAEAVKEKDPRARKKAKSRQAELLTKTEEGMALPEAVAKARKDCVLRYLNGAAPVIYGIPLSLR